VARRRRHRPSRATRTRPRKSIAIFENEKWWRAQSRRAANECNHPIHHLIQRTKSTSDMLVLMNTNIVHTVITAAPP
jgi:hypothetical protein